jgi:hypothetical protein
MGQVFPVLEFKAVLKLADNFRLLVPGTGDLPDSFKRLFFAEYDVRILPAKTDSRWQQAPSYVAVGSGAFNTSSLEFENQTHRSLFFEIKRDGNELALTGIRTPWKVYDRSAVGDGMLAIVAKAKFGNTTAFYCAGFDEIGSSGATYFLANNWQALAEQFGSSDFIVLLDFWGAQDIQKQPIIRHKCEWNWLKI